jgi:hypothetical protein
MSFVMSAGDGSERCVVCGLRNADKSWYIQWVPFGGAWPESIGYPVCGWEHALIWQDRYPFTPPLLFVDTP